MFTALLQFRAYRNRSYDENNDITTALVDEPFENLKLEAESVNDSLPMVRNRGKRISRGINAAGCEEQIKYLRDLSLGCLPKQLVIMLIILQMLTVDATFKKICLVKK
jgi:hypothetical protein